MHVRVAGRNEVVMSLHCLAENEFPPTPNIQAREVVDGRKRSFSVGAEEGNYNQQQETKYAEEQTRNPVDFHGSFPVHIAGYRGRGWDQ